MHMYFSVFLFCLSSVFFCLLFSVLEVEVIVHTVFRLRQITSHCIRSPVQHSVCRGLKQGITLSGDSYVALLQEVALFHDPNQQKHRRQTSLQGWIRLQEAAAFLRLRLTDFMCVCAVYLRYTV